MIAEDGDSKEKETEAAIVAEGGRGDILPYKGKGKRKEEVEKRKYQKDEMKIYKGNRLAQE